MHQICFDKLAGNKKKKLPPSPPQKKTKQLLERWLRERAACLANHSSDTEIYQLVSFDKNHYLIFLITTFSRLQSDSSLIQPYTDKCWIGLGGRVIHQKWQITSSLTVCMQTLPSELRITQVRKTFLEIDCWYFLNLLNATKYRYSTRFEINFEAVKGTASISWNLTQAIY